MAHSAIAAFRMTAMHSLDERRLAQLNLFDFYRSQAAWSGAAGATAAIDGVLLYGTATDFPVTCNGAARLDPSTPDDVALDVAVAWFAARGTGFTLQVEDPDGVDAGLVAAAEERGLVTLSHAPAMVCRARLDDAVAPDGVELRWVAAGSGDDHDPLADDFVSVSDRAYQSLGMPAGVIEQVCVRRDLFAADGVHTVVATDGGRPVAAAQLQLSDPVDGIAVAGVYYVGTLEAARGRGLGELVTRAVTNLGFDLGAAFASLQATEMGAPVYRRMGYELLTTYRGLVRF